VHDPFAGLAVRVVLIDVDALREFVTDVVVLAKVGSDALGDAQSAGGCLAKDALVEVGAGVGAELELRATLTLHDRPSLCSTPGSEVEARRASSR
jgi:hypothetical protein